MDEFVPKVRNASTVRALKDTVQFEGGDNASEWRRKVGCLIVDGLRQWGSGPGARGCTGCSAGGSVNQTLEEQALPVFTDQSVSAIAERAAIRLAAFLERELGEIPAWHPTTARYQEQIRRLRRVCPVGPRSR